MYLPINRVTSLLSLSVFMAITFYSANLFAAESIESFAEKAKENIAQMKKKRTIWTDADRAIMKAAEEQLANDLPNPGLKAGNKAPNFALKNAFGETIE